MTARALTKDTADTRKLLSTREKGLGRRVPPPVASYFPYFFTRDAATMPLAGLYYGASCFLIGSGPSFRLVPREQLSSVWTMTLNNAHAGFRGRASCVVDEPSRFSLSMWLDPLIQKFVPMGYFENELWDNRLLREDDAMQQRWAMSTVRVGDCPNVVGFRRNEKFHAPRWLHEDTINWGNHKKHGGGRSVLLAALRIVYLLGFRQVYLLGVDFQMAPDYRYHFDEERTDQAVQNNNSTYEKLQRWFTELQPYFLKDGFSVYNCNLESKLTAFPMMPFDEAIARALAELGDYKNERTNGMYTPLKERASGQADSTQPAASSC